MREQRLHLSCNSLCVGRAFLAWGIIMACLLGSPLVAQEAGKLRLPPVQGRPAADLRVITLASPDASLLGLLRRAFALHGGFQVRESGPSHFDFLFQPSGSNAVTVVISSGGKELERQTAQAGSVTEAALRAADQAVLRTTGRPGFFAGRLAFVSTRSGHKEVYTSDLLFSSIKQWTRDGSDAVVPDIAPDSQRILYTSYHRTGFPDIFEINVRTGQRRVFAAFRGMNTGPTFSPDGRQVAMILSSAGNAELYTCSADGSGLRRLTTTKALEADPAWSPDGQRLAFAADDLGKPQIFTINADGTQRRRVPTNISRNCTEPNWNPVLPTLIAFTAASGNEFEIAVYDSAAGKSTIVTQGAGDAVHPVWLRDGRHIIYTARTRSRETLMIVDTISGRQVRVSPDDMRSCSMADYVY